MRNIFKNFAAIELKSVHRPRFALLLIACLLLPCTLFAQTSHGLWDDVKQTRTNAGKTVARTGSRIKKFKDHLQQWGMDSTYTHGLAIGARLNSTGWTGLLFYQTRISRIQSQFFQLALSEIKHEKQIKQQRDNIAFPALGASTPFIYGKLNNAYLLQLGHGREMLLLPGVLEGNMTISIRAQAGLSLAMLKPYYLKLIYVDYNPDPQARVSEEKYSDANSEKFLGTGYTLGAAKWSKGLNEITYVPGGYADAAIVIEPLKNKTFIKTVTLGSSFSIHTKALTIMADQKAYPWSGCVYVGLSLGKRWH